MTWLGCLRLYWFGHHKSRFHSKSSTTIHGKNATQIWTNIERMKKYPKLVCGMTFHTVQISDSSVRPLANVRMYEFFASLHDALIIFSVQNQPFFWPTSIYTLYYVAIWLQFFWAIRLFSSNGTTWHLNQFIYSIYIRLYMLSAQLKI